MHIKFFGAMLIILSCAFFGFSKAANHRREENSLRLLLAALDYIQCELQYRLTPLPDLCRQAGNQSRGSIKKILHALSSELESQISPDVHSCVQAALNRVADMGKTSQEALELLGSSLGCFDLDGQIQGIEAVRKFCRNELEVLLCNRDSRLRSYQTLGLCAGAALAILFV